MIIQTNDIANVSPVSAGSRVTVSLPVGEFSYDYVALRLEGGLKKSMLSNIKLRVNTKTLQEFNSVSELEMIQRYYKAYIANDLVVFAFAREHLQLAHEAQSFSWGMADVGVFQISFDIASNAPASSNIKAYSNRAGAAPLGAITKIERLTAQPSAAGRFEIDSIPRRALIQAIHLQSGAINHVELRANSVVQFEASAQRAKDIVKRFGRQPQDGVFHVDFCSKNVLGTQLVADALQDFRLVLDMEEASAINVIVEYHDGY